MNTANIESFWGHEDWLKVKHLSETQEPPFIVLNKRIVRQKFQELSENFPFADIFFAVKANPHPEILKMLVEMGCSFDVASVYELDRVLALGAHPDRISYGNTIKKSAHIRYAYEKGIRLFATDSEPDLRHIAAAAPGSRVFFRLLMDESRTADWPLSRKFGCHSDMAVDLITLAKHLNVQPYGISFHVGSQQRDIGAWDAALGKVKYIFDWCEQDLGIKLELINMGGGFPATYLARTNDMSVYAREITRFLREDYEDHLPRIILEPGRSLMGDAGVIVSEVVLISRKFKTALNRWVYTDVGKFNGLIETLDESIKYPLFTERTGELEEAILAGPTCDSMDIMYEKYMYPLPMNLSIGDKLFWLSTGAYTGSYASVEFNGFPPIRTIVLD